MKKMRLIGLVMIAAIMFGCAGEVKYNTLSFNDKQFTLDVPTYMEEQSGINPEASMEYGSEIKAHFAMVIAESKESLMQEGLDFSVEEYADFAVGFTKDALKEAEVEKVSESIQTINGMEAISYKVRGIFEEIDERLFYYMTIFKSENNFYNFTTYTFAGREGKYTPIMEKMINSFKEN